MNELQAAGLRLRQWRRKQRLNRPALTALTGVSVRAIRSLEDGRTPCGRTLAGLARVIDLNWLLIGGPHRDPEVMGD
jgi:transcriptional regulator with XRE-family HTH domain